MSEEWNQQQPIEQERMPEEAVAPQPRRWPWTLTWIGVGICVLLVLLKVANMWTLWKDQVPTQRAVAVASTPTPTPTRQPTQAPTRKPTSTPWPTRKPTPTKKAKAAASAAQSPPEGKVWVWHGRLTPCGGFEYVVEYPSGYDGTLQWWATIPDACRDELGNDSLKGIDPDSPTGRWWADAMASFPKASWLDVPNLIVWEHDSSSGGYGAKWTLTRSADIPEAFDWLVQNGHKVDIQVVDANGQPIEGVRIIRWIESREFPYK